MGSQAGFAGPFTMKGLNSGYVNNRSISNYNSVYESFKSNEVITSIIKSPSENTGVFINNLFCNSITAGTSIINNIVLSTGTFIDITVGTGNFNTIIAGTGIFQNLSFGSANVPIITATTGIITDLYCNNIVTNTITAGTGIIRIPELEIGTGNFINANIGTGNISNLISQNIQSQLSNITTLQVGTGTFTNILGPIANTTSTGILSYQDWNLFNLGIQTQNIIAVQMNPNRYQFSSIASAITYAITLSPSNLNPITITVGPGLYIEPLITVPSFVRLIGNIGSTFIFPNGLHNIVNLSAQSSISGCVLSNAPSTYCAIYANDTSVYSQASDLYITNCDIGIKLKTTTTTAVLYCSRIIITNTFTQAIVMDCTSNLQGTMNINGAAILPLSNSVIYGVNCTGNFYFTGSSLTNTGNGNGTMFNFDGEGYSFVLSTIVNNWTTFMTLNGTNYSHTTNGSANVDCTNGILATGTGNCIFTGISFNNNTTSQLNIGANVTGYYSGPFTRSKITINSSSTFIISNEDLNIITVAKAGGNFNSIKQACDFITDSSSTNRYLVTVGPGVYIEDQIDLTTKPYVSVYGQIIQGVVIKPVSQTQHLFLLGIFNELSFLWLEGTGTGYAGIAVLNSGDYSLAHKITFNDCDIGILVTSDSVVTKFYGEYLDMNGTFSYATKIISTNTGDTFVNLENYYPIPTSLVTQSIGTYISGTNSTVNMNVSGFIGAGLGKGYVIENGGNLLLQSSNIENCVTGIEVTNTTGIPTLNMNGIYFKDNTDDIIISSTTTLGTFSGNADITKITNLSDGFHWSFLDITTGAYEITNKLSMTFPNRVNTDLTTSLIEGTTSGLLSGGVISISSGLEISVTSGYGYVEMLESKVPTLYKVEWNDSKITLPSNSENYIYFTKLGVLSSSTSLPDIIKNVFIGRVVTSLSSIIFIDSTDMNAAHYSNANFTYLLNAIGPVYASGSITTENVTPFKLDVTSGSYYVATVPFNPSGSNSLTFTQFNYNGSSTWQLSSLSTVNNSQYNNGTTLTSLTASYYTQHSLYLVGEGKDEQYFLVLGQQEFSSEISATNATIPTPPTYFINGVVLIAGIIVQQGASSISSIIDQRPVIGYRATGTTSSGDHQSLFNRDALTAHTQYLLKNEIDSMGINLDMGTFNIVNLTNISDTTNPLQSMIPTAHGSRHLPNGQDALTTTAPITNLSATTTNSTGTANSFSRSDHIHAIDSFAINGTNTLMKRDLNGSTTLSFINLNNTSNQLVIGTGTISTINFSVPSLSNILTIPDTNGDSNFIMGKTTSVSQNINGLLTLTSTGTYNSGFVIGNDIYSVNVASQTGTTVTGITTVFTQQMIGGIIRFANGIQSFITNVIDGLNMIVRPSQSVSQQAYVIYYSGSQFDSIGNCGISYLYGNTGVFNNLSAINSSFGTGSFTNLNTNTITSGTGIFTNIISNNISSLVNISVGTGTFTNIISTNGTIQNINSNTITSGTGSFSNIFLSSNTKLIPSVNTSTSIIETFPMRTCSIRSEDDNLIRVEKGGNDTNGSRGGFPFLTIAAALTVALDGDLVYVSPGTYTENALTIPTGVGLIGLSRSQCVITNANTSGSLSLITMGIRTYINNFTISLTNLTGPNSSLNSILFPSTTNLTASINNCTITTTNTVISTAGTFTAIKVDASGVPPSTFVNVNNCSLTCVSSAATSLDAYCYAVLLSTSVSTFNIWNSSLICTTAGTTLTYSVGTASQSLNAITGIGTTFTSAMVGGVIRFANGSQGQISAFTNTTSITSYLSQTATAQTFVITYGGNAYCGATTLDSQVLNLRNCNCNTQNLEVFGDINLYNTTVSSSGSIFTSPISVVTSDNRQIQTSTIETTDIIPCFQGGITITNFATATTLNGAVYKIDRPTTFTKLQMSISSLTVSGPLFIAVYQRTGGISANTANPASLVGVFNPTPIATGQITTPIVRGVGYLSPGICYVLFGRTSGNFAIEVYANSTNSAIITGTSVQTGYTPNCFTTNISAASIPATFNPTVGGGTITTSLSALAMTCRLQS